jgi:hypothetical protein
MKYLLAGFTVLLITAAWAESRSGAQQVRTRTPTPEATEEANVLTIEADEGPLEFTDYHVNEARFNPNPEKPAALNIMASLHFQNTSRERLEVRSPRFALKINGVEWTNLTSTDFQIGRLQPGAGQGIELQSLLIIRKATEEQEPILEDIKAGLPVDLEITGTILVYPQGKEQTLEVTITLEKVILPSEWLRPGDD